MANPNPFLIMESKVYNLSTNETSCRCLNGTWKSKCEYVVPNMIERDETIEYVMFSVPTAVIPNAFYNISEANNQLVVIVSGITTTYKFPLGNYTATTFIAQFNSLLGTEWSLTINYTTNRFTVTGPANFTLSVDSTIQTVIGFSTDVIAVGTRTEVMPESFNFYPVPRVCLRCPELANTVVVGKSPCTDVVATIPNDAPLNGQIYYLNQSNIKLLFRHHELTRFILTLTDDDGNLLNFNGLTSYFTFQFDIFRKYVPKPPRFGNIIEYVNGKMAAMYPGEEQMVSEGI